MIVIELRNCGNRAGLFETLTGAKQAAQKILDSYIRMYAKFSEEEREGSQPLTTDTLWWDVVRIDHHGQRVGEDDPVSWETLTAFYSAKNGYFTIHEIEVGP